MTTPKSCSINVFETKSYRCRRHLQLIGIKLHQIDITLLDQFKKPFGGIMRKIFYLALLAVTVFSQLATAQQKMGGPNAPTNFVSVEDAAKTALNVGAKMPAFTLNDSLGKPVGSKDLLKQGNLVVVFYRGAWCPFCNKYLHQLQQ